MTNRQIHTIQRPPRTPSNGPPLLFLHGGYMDSRSWDAHFLPYFAERGHHCHALDFSGHGRSDGHADRDALSVDDYLADSLQVIGAIGRKPVVIGHSMGALIAERILERSQAVAGVLISPVPANGTLESAMKLLLRYPQFLREVANIGRGRVSAQVLRLLKEVYFSPTTTPETLLRFTELVQPESVRAICDLTLVGWRWPARRPELPVLVVTGELDTVFPPSMILPVAKRWNAELQIVADTGHALILDEHWQTGAAGVLGWLQGLDTAQARFSGSAQQLPCGV